MDTLALITTVITEIGVLIGVVAPIAVKVRKISEGTKCQLRSDMLRIYYDCLDKREIRQYEYENFVYLYEAYKALGGNSFMDEIYEKIKEFKIIT